MTHKNHALRGRKQKPEHIAKRMAWAHTSEGHEKIMSALRRRWGDPTDRFWSKVDRRGPCWLWTAAHDQHGYGSYYWEGRLQKAHRVAWQIECGPIPAGMMALHKCDIPCCVNPEHLFLGTQAENMFDMAKKGRAKGGPGAKCGERHHEAKLTREMVADARARVASGERLTWLARELGVHHSTLSVAVRGKTWAEVKVA